jgi:hypothetical protein
MTVNLHRKDVLYRMEIGIKNKIFEVILRSQTTLDVLASSAIPNLPLFKVDVKAAILQTGPVRRFAFVRPPSDLLLPGKLWKLLTAACGLTEANRFFQRHSDDVAVDLGNIGMQSVHGLVASPLVLPFLVQTKF